MAEIDYEVDIDDNAEAKDIMDVFMDNSTKVLENDFLSSKKKLANANNGKSEIFELVRQKSKALDMINMILTNNKDLLKTEDFFFIDELKTIFNQGKNDKSLFESISKKVKSIISLIAKNQINLERREKYESLSNALYDILNTHFEHSFLQQIIDIIKSSDELLIIFMLNLMDKFFKGRNCIIKNQDIRFLIKLLFSVKGPFFFFNSIFKYAEPKETGGARTPHQIKQIFDLLTYVLDQFNNKIVGDKHSKNNEKEHFILFLGQFDNFHNILGLVASRVKFYLGKDEEYCKTKENKLLISGLIGFISRFISFIKKNTSFLIKSKEEGKLLIKSCSFIITNLRTIVEKVKDLKHLDEKINLIEEQMY